MPHHKSQSKFCCIFEGAIARVSTGRKMLPPLKNKRWKRNEVSNLHFKYLISLPEGSKPLPSKFWICMLQKVQRPSWISHSLSLEQGQFPGRKTEQQEVCFLPCSPGRIGETWTLLPVALNWDKVSPEIPALSSCSLSAWAAYAWFKISEN